MAGGVQPVAASGLGSARSRGCRSWPGHSYSSSEVRNEWRVIARQFGRFTVDRDRARHALRVGSSMGRGVARAMRIHRLYGQRQRRARYASVVSRAFDSTATRDEKRGLPRPLGQPPRPIATSDCISAQVEPHARLSELCTQVVRAATRSLDRFPHSIVHDQVRRPIDGCGSSGQLDVRVCPPTIRDLDHRQSGESRVPSKPHTWGYFSRDGLSRLGRES